MLWSSVYPNHALEKSREFFMPRRSFSPPYSLAPDMYSSSNDNSNRYETNQVKQTTLPPFLTYSTDKYRDIESTKNVRETFDHITDHDYRDLLFASNYDYDEYIENYLTSNQVNNDLLQLEDFVSQDPLAGSTNDLGNIQLTQSNVPSYNNSLLVGISSEDRPRDTKTIEEIEEEDESIVYPFVHPDHYQYLNPQKGIQGWLQPEVQHNSHPTTNSPKLELSANYNMPSEVVYDTGDWTPIFRYPTNVYGPKNIPSISLRSKIPPSKPVRFPSASKSFYEQLDLSKGSSLKRIDTLESSILQPNGRKKVKNDFKFKPLRSVPRRPIYFLQAKPRFKAKSNKYRQVESKKANHPFVRKDHKSNVNATGKDDNAKCYQRTCTQLITGRYLEYSQALKIIQSEGYLDYANLDRKKYPGKLIFQNRNNMQLNEISQNAVYNRRFKVHPYRNMLQYLRKMLMTRKKPSRIKRYLFENNWKLNKDVMCGGLLTEPGEILSPHYPNDYNTSASEMLTYRNCKWEVKCPSNQKIVLDFLELRLGDDLTNNEDCRFVIITSLIIFLLY